MAHSQRLAHEVAPLAQQGTSRRAIARALGVSRNTVRRLLAEHGETREFEHIAVTPRPPRARAPRSSTRRGHASPS